jgi:lysozyme family protein
MPRYSEWVKALSGIQTVNIGRITGDVTMTAIEKMSQLGNISRAILALRLAGKNAGGHVINVDYTNMNCMYMMRNRIQGLLEKSILKTICRIRC